MLSFLALLHPGEVFLDALGLRLELLEVLFQVGDNLLATVKTPLAVSVTAAAAMITTQVVRMMTALPMMTVTATAAPVFEMHLTTSHISIY